MRSGRRVRLVMKKVMNIRRMTWLAPSRKKTSYLVQPATDFTLAKTTEKVRTLMKNHMLPVKSWMMKFIRKFISRRTQFLIKDHHSFRYRTSDSYKLREGHGRLGRDLPPLLVGQ